MVVRSLTCCILGITLWILVCYLLTCPAAIAQSPQAESPGPDVKEQDFLREYEAGVARLEAALHSLQGSGRFEVSKSGTREKYVNLNFFTLGEELRYHRREAHRQAVEVALLDTPEIKAIVLHPNSEKALIDSLSEGPLPRISIERGLHFDRFLKASYCIDGVSILEEIKRGRIEVRSVEPYAENDDWVQVDYGFTTTASDMDVDSTGTGTLVLSPQEDWALRKVEYSVDPPFSFDVSLEIGLKEIEGAGYVVESLNRIHRDHPEVGELEEVTDFRLLECRVEETPAEEFELGALGVVNPREVGNRRMWLVALIILLLIIFEIGRNIVRRQNRSRAAVAEHGQLIEEIQNDSGD